MPGPECEKLSKILVVSPLQYYRQLSQATWAPSVNSCYTYMHSGNTKDSDFRALAEALTPAASLVMIQTVIAIPCDLVSKERQTLPLRWRLPCLSNSCKGLMMQYFARISVIPFEEVDNDSDNQSQRNDDSDMNLMILGQGPAVTSDTGFRARAGQQSPPISMVQWDSPWVTEARNALLSQDQQALSMMSGRIAPPFWWWSLRRPRSKTSYW